MKHIVVVYSHYGHALALAQAYAKAHNAALHRIEPKFEPKGFFTYVWYGYKASLKRTVKLKEDRINLKQYEKLTLFAPIHAGKICAPVRSYLLSHKAYLPKVDVILTHRAVDKDYKEAAHAIENELILKFSSINSVVVE